MLLFDTERSRMKRPGQQFLVKHGDSQYDIGGFLRRHPGGSNSLESYKDCDVAQRMTDHSPGAHYLLQEYRVACGKGGELEKLVDWSRPMLGQVGALGPRYSQWVAAPVDRPLRLFQSDVVEALTVTPWYLVPAVWVPVAAVCLYFGWHDCREMLLAGSLTTSWMLFSFLLGVVLWTLFEYSFHRWVFHMEPPAWSPFLITTHFLLHGLHHKVPFDHKRLLFPPFPALIIGFILYSATARLFPPWMVHLIAAGIVCAYMAYDLTHFYLHNGSPTADSYFYHMKRYHNQHHFTHHQAGFGISSPLWDHVFGTQILLRKLKWPLKW